MKQDSDTKLFCQKYSLKMIFIFFVIGCLIGTYYEEILNLIIYHHFETRQGVFWGPFSPIYGIGFAIFIIFLGEKNDYRGILKTWLLCTIIGGLTEYLESFIIDKIFGIEFWNYSGYFLNIHGRTTIPYMIGWGFGGMILLKVIYPWIYKLTTKVPVHIGNFIYYSLFLFLLIDSIITFSAVGRMILRNDGKKPNTLVGEFYDNVFSDDYIKKKFPLMTPTKY